MANYQKESYEWWRLADELARTGVPTAFDVSEEQRKRMASRGELPMTYEEILAEVAAAGITEK